MKLAALAFGVLVLGSLAFTLGRDVFLGPRQPVPLPTPGLVSSCPKCRGSDVAEGRAVGEYQLAAGGPYYECRRCRHRWHPWQQTIPAVPTR